VYSTLIFCKLLTNTVRIFSGTSLFYVLGHLSPITFTPCNNQNLHVLSLSTIDSLLAELESICRGKAGTWQVQSGCHARAPPPRGSQIALPAVIFGGGEGGNHSNDGVSPCTWTVRYFTTVDELSPEKIRVHAKRTLPYRS